MPFFRKKPVVIEAHNYVGTPNEFLETWLGEAFESWVPSKQQVIIRTLEGPITASAGDWIIKGTKGEFYPCKPDIFKEIYETCPT